MRSVLGLRRVSRWGSAAFQRHDATAAGDVHHQRLAVKPLPPEHVPSMLFGRLKQTFKGRDERSASTTRDRFDRSAGACC